MEPVCETSSRFELHVVVKKKQELPGDLWGQHYSAEDKVVLLHRPVRLDLRGTAPLVSVFFVELLERQLESVHSDGLGHFKLSGEFARRFSVLLTQRFVELRLNNYPTLFRSVVSASSASLLVIATLCFLKITDARSPAPQPPDPPSLHKRFVTVMLATLMRNCNASLATAANAK